MKWKMLAALDIAFSSLALISALMLGNGLLDELGPGLNENPTWLSELIMIVLIAPDLLAGNVVGWVPAMVMLPLWAVFFSAEVLLMTVSPLLVGMTAGAAAKKYDVDFRVAYREISANRSKVRWLKRRMRRRVMVNLLIKSYVAFGVGLAAGGIAWGIVLLVNADDGGIVLQTLAAIAVVVSLPFAKVAIDAILKKATIEDDGVDMVRDTFTQEAK